MYSLATCNVTTSFLYIISVFNVKDMHKLPPTWLFKYILTTIL